MWPFCRRRQEKKTRLIRNVVTGLVIGGAVGSVVGKHLVEKHEKEEGVEEYEKKDEEE